MVTRGDDPTHPVGPYRGSTLDVTLAPDRRAHVAAVLLGLGFGMGVLFHVGLVARREAKALEAVLFVAVGARTVEGSG